MEVLSHEARSLRRAMRDLVALSALPAVWMKLQPPELASSLAEVLQNTLRLDFAYLRLETESADRTIEVVHTDRGPMTASMAAEVGQALLQHSDESSSEALHEMPNPVGAGTVRFVSVPIICHGRAGRLVAGSLRADFPTVEQRMLLSVSANHAALMLERYRAEKSLSESESRYRSVITALHEGVILVGQDGVIHTCNAAAERILGLPAEQIMGRSTIDPRWGAIHEDGSPFPAESRPALVTLRTGRPLSNVVMGIRKPSGELSWISVNSEPLFRDGDARPHAAVASFADITARKESEEALQREQAARVRAESLARFGEASRRTLERLATSPHLDAFSGQVITAAVEHFGAIGGSVWEAMSDEDTRMIASFEEGKLRSPATSQLPALLNGRALAAVLFAPEGRKDVMIYDAAALATEPRYEGFRGYFARYGVRTLVSVPMYLRERFRGALTLRFAEDRTLTHEEAELARTFANQAVLAMELTRLSRAARVSAVSEERNRLARDIHDTLAQGLAAIVRQLESATAANQPVAIRHISIATEIARDSLVEARRSIRALRPPTLEGRSLRDAVRDLLQRVGPLSPAKMSLSTSGEAAAIPADVEDELFRIVHEALTNAINHAAARAIDVELSFEDASVRVLVRDDGSGFDSSHVGRDTVGLHSMRERAERVGAALTVASEHGSGTEVLAYWSATPS